MGLLSRADMSATSSAEPEAAVMAKANHINGKSVRSGASGMRRPKPRSRRSMPALTPDKVASPIVWQNRIAG